MHKISANKPVLILALLVCFFAVPQGADKYIIWGCLIIYYWQLLRAFRKPIIISNKIKSYFKINLLFLIFYYLVLYFPYQTYVLGVDNLENNPWISDSFIKYSNEAIIATTIGMLSFLSGFEKRLIANKRKEKAEMYLKSQYKNLFIVVLFFCTLLFTLLYILGAFSNLAQSYAGPTTSDSSFDSIYSIYFVFITILASFSVVYFSRYRHINIYMIFFLALLAVSLYLALVGGDRNTFFLVAIAFGGGIYTFIKSISRTLLLLYGALAIFLYQVVEVSRMADKRDLATILLVATGQIEVKSGSTIGTDIDQSSFSTTNVATRASFAFVPKTHDFFYGKFKLVGLIGTIPFAKGLVISPNDPYSASSRFITDKLGSSFGAGTSIIADIYLDFGIIGVILLLYLLGILANLIQLKASVPAPQLKWLVLYLIALGLYAELPRYSFDFIAKSIVWCTLMFKIFESVTKPYPMLRWVGKKIIFRHHIKMKL